MDYPHLLLILAYAFSRDLKPIPRKKLLERFNLRESYTDEEAAIIRKSDGWKRAMDIEKIPRTYPPVVENGELQFPSNTISFEGNVENSSDSESLDPKTGTSSCKRKIND